MFATLSAQVLLRPIEALLNRNVEASTPARALRASLTGRSLAVAIEGPALTLRLAVEPTRLALGFSDLPADAQVAGSPLALLSLLKDPAAGSVRASGVKVSGDPQIAQAFARLLEQARPELEEELARLLGEVPAYHGARLARGVARFVSQAGESLSRNVAEYLQEESRDLASRAELNAQHAGVDRLREAVDRAEARLLLLEARHGRGTR